MKKTTNILSIILVIAALAILVFGRYGQPVIRPVVTVYVTQEISATPVSPELTADPEPVASSEPQPEYFTFSFIGDCTLTSFNGGTDYRNKMGDDYSYPFKNTIQFFKSPDFT